MKEIGGYFSLELNHQIEYHSDAIKLMSARNAFCYILRAQNVKKVYIPVLICDSLLEPLIDEDISYCFYNIDDFFEIVGTIELEESAKILYVNYYGLKKDYIKNCLVKRYNKNLIIDNTQSFYEKPLKHIDTIYSPRKFFGVSDGGYLYTDVRLNEEISIDDNSNYQLQLIGRINGQATNYYSNFQESEKRLSHQDVKRMSLFTYEVLNSIDYISVKESRLTNFLFLHDKLHKLNLLKINTKSMSIPMVYPFMTTNSKLRDCLISNRVYIPIYWKEVLFRAEVNKIEKKFVNKILPLPCDQRYTINDMKEIVKIVSEMK